MLCELIAISYVLRKWNKNPFATKRQIGGWSNWMTDDQKNDETLSDKEVSRMKDFLLKNNPSALKSIFEIKRHVP